MRSLIQEWLQYCEVDIESSIVMEYDGLFMDNITEEEIQAIFRPFTNSDELFKRMTRYLNDYRNDGIKDSVENKKDYMESLLKLDFEERKPDIEGVHYFKDVTFPTKYQFISNFKEVDNQTMGDLFSQDFNDYFRKRKIDKKDKTYALYGAIRNISIHYSYTQYLFQPLVDMNYTANHIYEFLMRGGTYAVLEDTVYYSFR